MLLLAVFVFGWVRSYREVDGLREVEFPWFKSGYDGDRQYDNSFVATIDGEIFFEWENLEYSQRPATAPSDLYHAEDDVGVGTPNLRGFGWVEPYGFQYAYVGA